MHTDISSEFIKELDAFYAQEDLQGALAFLTEALDKSRRGLSPLSPLTVLNELTGLYRQTKQEKEGMLCIDECAVLLENTQIPDKDRGTILLNCATTMKSFGKAAQAMDLYTKAEELLTSSLPAHDPLIAGLYNNMALAFQDNGSTDKAAQYFQKALEITGNSKEQALEYAITCVNLAHLRFEKNYLDESVNALLDEAMKTLDNPDCRRFDKYAFTCRKCAPSYGYFGRFADEKTLNERAERIYEGNRNKQKIL